ncbi:MAG: type II toxin-antitoxin system Phd/YefM family antitoxin [Candidatus Sulfotelmatobacter sp.]
MAFVKAVSLSEFRMRCSALVDAIHATREPVLITKRGKPVARIVPAGRPAKFIGRLKGVFKIVGDIESPINPEEWESSWRPESMSKAADKSARPSRVAPHKLQS